MGAADLLREATVLVVDDTPDNLSLMVDLLKDDYKVKVARSGEKALQIAAGDHPPDLILLDIMMPGIDGYEVCRRMRASPASRDIPVMFLSSLEDARDKAEGFEAGGNDYLTKPFHAVEVKARVRSLLKAKAYQDAVKEARARELDIAREIQRGILPIDLATATANSGLDVHAHLEPASEVGGDLFEVIRASDDRLVVALGDVSGKGIPAALFMAVTVTLLRSMSSLLGGPDAILRGVNEELASRNPRGLFVTLFCAVVDLKRRLLSIANCGHPPPVLLRNGSPPEFVFPATGTVAGVIPGIEIATETVPLVRGRTYVLYTDGVTEAFDPDGVQFGYDRLLAVHSGVTDAPAAEIVRTVVRSVAAHARGAPPSDDLAVLVLRVP
jgi:sigma-B regulation protein RsbU (phosphoserine phosphatase)